MLRRDVFIGVFLAVQLVLPLQYYFGREDTNDERFAWRMFSETRMLRCKPMFFRGDSKRPAKLSREFHIAWVNIAKRGRMEVIEAMAEHMCKKAPGTSLRVAVPCVDPHGNETQLTAPQWDVCALGGLQ